VKARLKGRERDGSSRSRVLSTRERRTYAEDKLPVFILVDRGSGKRYVIPAKAADESMSRLLLAVGQQESLTVYIDGFRAYDPLEEDDTFDREYVVHGDEDIHVNAAKAKRRGRGGGSRRIRASPRTDSHRIYEPSSSVMKSSENPKKKR
jgi:transposase